MMERVHLKKSKVTGKYEVIKTEQLSPAEEAERLYDARQKAAWDEMSRTRTARNKAIREIASNLIKSGYTDQQIHEFTTLPFAEIEGLREKSLTASVNLNQATVELNQLSQTEEAERLDEQRQKAIRDENARMRTALNKGHDTAMREVVINSIALGLESEQIFKITGMPIAKIEDMRNQ